MYPQKPKINVGIAYLLWALGFFGICGIHRFYMGKTTSGIVWLLTAGLCGFGQFIDVVLIPGMVQERNLYLWEKARADRLLNMIETGQNIKINPVASDASEQLEEKIDPMLKLLKAAAANGNVLSIGQAMISTGMSHEEVEELLKKAQRKGIAYIDNDPKSGAIRYYFDI
ncbi:MAG: TM2 domain-containing protein [Hydrococcus sp. C42_A2020_068]|uniref:TM2 domain-containing protein n=1 Tax=Pleurocapsa sp. PCC 7327 TaxID=118163 RepID=UPI00029FDBF4|nr:TM2 domain-containing protein [Pleurocapsa sp. PCC 7327]AFY79071.1 putative membrane protein [Pleurocapsa sp. PCC 7327]MBF2022780.1 TM2 domain-containing protein [Hydrococcus sp. C42_A2020_068]